MKKKLIFGLALLFLATAYTFAGGILLFIGNNSNAIYEAWAESIAAADNLRPSKVPNYIMGILNSQLNQYNLSDGDIFSFYYSDSPYHTFRIYLRVTNAKNGEYEYKVFDQFD